MATEKEISASKIFELFKTWFPVVLTIGGLFSGYILFKAETEHQFQLVALRNQQYDERLQALSDDISRNKTEWQREVDRQLRETREALLVIEVRLDNLEERINSRTVTSAPLPSSSSRRIRLSAGSSSDASTIAEVPNLDSNP